MTAVQRIPGLQQRNVAKVAARIGGYPALFCIAAILVSLCVVAGVMWVTRPQLRESNDMVKSWTFDQRPGDDRGPLSEFQVTVSGHPADSLIVGSDGLTQGVSSVANSATYIQKELPGPVTRIGVTVTFPATDPPSTGGAVGLLVPARTLPADAALIDTETPDMAIHFVIDANSWLMATWRHDSGMQVLGMGPFKPALTATHSVDLIRRSDEVVIFLPQGETYSFRDPNIANWSSNFAGWELYEKEPDTTPAVINRFWAAWSEK